MPVKHTYLAMKKCLWLITSDHTVAPLQFRGRTLITNFILQSICFSASALKVPAHFHCLQEKRDSGKVYFLVGFSPSAYLYSINVWVELIVGVTGSEKLSAISFWGSWSRVIAVCLRLFCYWFECIPTVLCDLCYAFQNQLYISFTQTEVTMFLYLKLSSAAREELGKNNILLF